MTAIAGVLLAIMGVSASGGDSAQGPSFEKALQLAKANRGTAQGKQYDAQLAKYSEAHDADITGACIETERPPNVAPFQVVLEVSMDGSISKAMVKPETNVGKCYRDKVRERGHLPKPPHAGYWILVEMSFSP